MNMDRSDFILAMRYVANSVTVVTTNGIAGRHGATVSAFCSVSADPPTALVCLHAQSRIANFVITNGEFNINVLPQEAQGIAERFAGKDDSSLTDRFDGLRVREGGIPSIPGATVLTCEVDQSIPSGSHLVVIGRVKEVVNGSAQPLTYLDGSYRSVMPLGRDWGTDGSHE